MGQGRTELAKLVWRVNGNDGSCESHALRFAVEEREELLTAEGRGCGSVAPAANQAALRSVVQVGAAHLAQQDLPAVSPGVCEPVLWRLGCGSRPVPAPCGRLAPPFLLRLPEALQ